MEAARRDALPLSQLLQWQKDERKALDKLGIRGPNPAPWTSRVTTQLQGLIGNERERSVIDTIWMEHCKNINVDCYTACPPDGLFCDPSQCLKRARQLQIGCLMKKSTKYSFYLDRVLLSSDWMGLLGFPRRGLQSVPSERQRLDMVGECMAAPCLGTALFALLHFLESDNLFEKTSSIAPSPDFTTPPHKRTKVDVSP
eukprot:856138-Pyramimonas_sp.AAC.2